MTHIFRSLWVGDSLSPYERMCLRSFIDRGHGFELYSYTSELDVPRGVVLRDAAEILPKRLCFPYRAGFGEGSFSGGSNLFRYHLLSRNGGWWVDTDVICLSEEIATYRRFFAHEDDEFLNGAVLHFAPGDALIDACLLRAHAIGENAKWGEIGPRLITQVVSDAGVIAQAQPAGLCYPIHWSEALELLLPCHADVNRRKLGEALFLHLWNEMFRQARIAKDILPPRQCLLRELADEHPVEGWAGEYVVSRQFAGDERLPDWLAANLTVRPLT
jgi:hypothetical protein